MFAGAIARAAFGGLRIRHSRFPLEAVTVAKCARLSTACSAHSTDGLNVAGHLLINRRLQCQGFNDKNEYRRKTPCDDDTLRKAVKDVPAEHWLQWFNEWAQQIFQRYGFFDPQGIFLGDGSYLFVPDNPAYEGSVVMWFDEHNHPVDYDKLSAQERRKAHRERCYSQGSGS